MRPLILQSLIQETIIREFWILKNELFLDSFNRTNTSFSLSSEGLILCIMIATLGIYGYLSYSLNQEDMDCNPEKSIAEIILNICCLNWQKCKGLTYWYCSSYFGSCFLKGLCWCVGLRDSSRPQNYKKVFIPLFCVFAFCITSISGHRKRFWTRQRQWKLVFSKKKKVF